MGIQFSLDLKIYSSVKASAFPIYPLAKKENPFFARSKHPSLVVSKTA
jgi:hypothetical protein